MITSKIRGVQRIFYMQGKQIMQFKQHFQVEINIKNERAEFEVCKIDRFKSAVKSLPYVLFWSEIKSTGTPPQQSERTMVQRTATCLFAKRRIRDGTTKRKTSQWSERDGI